MHHTISTFEASICSPRRRGERGIALLMALLAMLLLSAIGLGMMYMSSTESSINSNYRDSQLAFFAMRAGLEEARDRMRNTAAIPLVLPTTMPGTPNSILYVRNPAGAGDVIDPKTVGNVSSPPYFDDELCHETFSTLGLANPGANVPCAVGPLANNVVYTPSTSPNTNTAAALNYKWVRITLKQNGSITNAPVDAAQPLTTQACWQSVAQQEVALTSYPGGPYPDCATAATSGQDASPVYLVTTLAVTPTGSRRIGQYEVGTLNFQPPPVALGLDGPGASFSPRPSSNNYFIDGNDTGAAGFTSTGGTGGCTPSGPASVPAIGTADAAGAAGITAAVTANPNRSGNYTGSGGTPAIVNAGAGGTGQYTGGWASPGELDNLVNSIADVADTTYTCGIGTPCSPSGPIGTNANPQITYVDGDFNFGNGSGAGVLVVTGTLSFSGNATFNGLILVIGQGIVSENGGGSGGFNGSMFVAKTRNAAAPYAELPILGTPTFNWNGGGNSFIQYNSCWSKIGSNMRYSIIAMREEMY